jgi:glycerate dehydrogenase
MKIIFLDSDTVGSDIDLDPIAKLGNFISYTFTKTEDIACRLVNADVAIVNKTAITKKIMDASAP